MLPRVDNAITPATPVDAAVTTSIIGTKQDLLSSLSQSQVGNQLQGEVLSRLNDGTFVVRVADMNARMALPNNSQVGDKLQLTLLAVNPRPVFQLSNGAQSTANLTGTAQEMMETALQQVGARNPSASGGQAQSQENQPGAQVGLGKTTAAAPLESLSNASVLANAAEVEANSSAPTQLSMAGRIIDQALQAGLQANAATNVVGKTPLVTANTNFPDTAALANTLKQAISSSGLFYESHVAQWAEGKYPLPALQQEPQSSFGTGTQNLMQSAVQLHANAAQLMNLQLNTMEQNRVVWHGQLLPNQNMEWEISKQSQQKSSADQDQDTAASWQSVVRFELPNLGAVSATINLHANHMQLFLRANNPETVNDLQQHAQALAQALKVTGTQLDSLAIKQDDKA